MVEASEGLVPGRASCKSPQILVTMAETADRAVLDLIVLKRHLETNATASVGWWVWHHGLAATAIDCNATYRQPRKC